MKPTGGAAAFNGALRALAHLGVSVYGTRLLAVRGRKSGAWRTTVVNVLEHEGGRYLVAPRGETEWVRNLRAAGGGELRLGRRREAFRAHELPDADKPAVVRAYLRRWGFEVKAFFPELGPDTSDEDLLRVADRYPVFRLAGAS